MNRVDRPLPRERQTMAGRFAGGLRVHAATVGFLVLLVAFIGLVLLPGYRLANQLAADTAALKVASEQRGQPAAIARSLVAIRDRLGSGVYVAQALRDLGTSIGEFDRGLTQLRQSAAGDSAELREIDSVWSAYRQALVPVSGFKGLPYRDSDSAGVQLNAPGQRLLKDARQAIKVSHEATEGLNSALSSVSTSLEQQVVTASATLRTLMITGVVFAALLLTLLAYFQWLKARHERIAVEARNQTRDILSTVKDGLFLIDADFRIGQAHSTALSTLFRRDDFSKLTLEDLLRDTVSEDARHGHEVREAAVGRARQGEPDPEHQPAGGSGGAVRACGWRPRPAVSPVRLPPRQGRRGRAPSPGLRKRRDLPVSCSLAN